MKIIGKRVVIKCKLNRKVGSDRPRDFTIKYDHMPKMTVLKGIKKLLLTTAKPNYFSTLTKSRRVKEMGFLSKLWGKYVFCGQ